MKTIKISNIIPEICLGLFLLCGIFYISSFTGIIGYTPKIGEVYRLDSEDNPFKYQERFNVIDVKDGYILYYSTNEFGRFSTNSWKLRDWRVSFTKIK